ncbi:MAG: translation initiation factor IF-3 [Synergistaceae bacterium]|nr:translation initiation factor IF-3 [Synergistaceae bacterium]
MCVAALVFQNTARRWSVISNTNAYKEDEPRVNSEIRASEVLLIDDQGNKLGVVPTKEALRLSEERELDLVEVAPQATPPVCRILDYGKYRFQQQKRDKDARKKQKNQTVKEMKMRPKIDQHDYDFKVRAIKGFLEDGHRVKVSIFFRGREMAFLDRGREVLNRVMSDISPLGKVETEPRMEGAYMRMMVSPGSVMGAPAPAKQPEKPKQAGREGGAEKA